MKKYAAVFRLAWNRVWVYRGVSIVYLLLSLVNIFLNIIVWQIAYATGTLRSGIPFSQFISYFLLVIVIHQLVNSFSAGIIAEEHIKRGELNTFLLKPFPYFIYMMILEIPWRIFSFILSLPIFVLLVLLYKYTFSLQIESLPFVLLLIIFAYLLSFLIQITLAQLTFWFEDAHGILSAWEVLWLLFAGAGIPLFFLPPWLTTINNLLPFQYIVYFPVMNGLGRLTFDERIRGLFILCLWISLFFIIAQILWKKGLRKFTGEGI